MPGMKRKDEKIVHFGGIHCYCCTPMGKPADSKKAISKRDRRKTKQNLKNWA